MVPVLDCRPGALFLTYQKGLENHLSSAFHFFLGLTSPHRSASLKAPAVVMDLCFLVTMILFIRRLRDKAESKEKESLCTLVSHEVHWAPTDALESLHCITAEDRAAESHFIHDTK